LFVELVCSDSFVCKTSSDFLCVYFIHRRSFSLFTVRDHSDSPQCVWVGHGWSSCFVCSLHIAVWPLDHVGSPVAFDVDVAITFVFFFILKVLFSYILIRQQVRQRAVSASERHTIDFNRLESVAVDRFSTNESMTLDVKSSPMESNFNKNMEPSVLLSHMNPTISNRMNSNVPLETRSPLLRHQGVGMHHVDDCVEL
jgi:hypothetical protein